MRNINKKEEREVIPEQKKESDKKIWISHWAKMYNERREP